MRSDDRCRPWACTSTSPGGRCQQRRPTRHRQPFIWKQHRIGWGSWGAPTLRPSRCRSARNSQALPLAMATRTPTRTMPCPSSDTIGVGWIHRARSIPNVDRGRRGRHMAAHLYIPSLDSTPNQPSTLSRSIVQGICAMNWALKACAHRRHDHEGLPSPKLPRPTRMHCSLETTCCFSRVNPLQRWMRSKDRYAPDDGFRAHRGKMPPGVGR